MPAALEGSQAIARAVALCRPQVVAAYPITPQTHIVENISKLVADGRFDCELVSVESEFSAASVVLGAAAAGARAYTASSSQGILLMTEVLYDISGMRIPLVLTCANRAVSAPLNIWNDQQDAMAVRDSGWIMLFCADNQEAVDTTVQAFRIAERTELPVMVCVDGFTLTHTLEPIDLPSQEDVDAFLPPFEFERRLDPARPISQGTLVSPEWFPEVRHANYQALLAAEAEIEAAARDWAGLVGRETGALVEADGPGEARTGVLCMGSIHGTLEAARAAAPDLEPVRLIRLRCFRPLPLAAIEAACAGLDRLIVLERAIAPGLGGVLTTELRAFFADRADAPRIYGFAVGLGGRDVPLETLGRALASSAADNPRHFAVLDLEPEKLPEEDR